MEEDASQEGDDSKRNQGEAAVALEHCSRLVAAGLQLWEIGVITPYNAQASPVIPSLESLNPKP